MSSKILKSLLNKSIFNQLLLTYVLIGILPAGLIGLVSFRVSEQLLEAQISVSNKNTLDQIDKNITVLIDQVTAVVNMYNMNGELEALLTENYNDLYEELSGRSIIESQMIQYSLAFDWLQFQSFLIGDNGVIYSRNYEGGKVDIESLHANNWHALLEDDPDVINWIDTHPSYLNSNSRANVFSAAKLLMNHYTHRSYGILLISVKESNLYNIYKDLLSGGAEIYIVDSDMNVISHSNRELVGRKLPAADKEMFAGLSGGYRINDLGDKPVMTLYQKANAIDWYIVHNIPLSSTFQDINILKTNVMVVMLVCIAIAIAAAFLISYKIAMPLRNLSRKIRNFSLHGHQPPNSRQVNEVGLLSTEYDNMIEKLERTINDLVQNQEEKRLAELKALQMQINPHFLYNTLNSIKSLVWVGKTDRIEHTINALVDLLQRTIYRNDEMITIRDEVETIKNYIYIQKIRTDEEIEMVYKLDDAIWESKIPKLLLQPIIENAIFHGIESHSKPGKITLHGTVSGSVITLSVTDNGAGMQPETLQRIFSAEGERTAPRFSGIGIRNVDERLKLYYGPQYGLTIKSEFGSGTSVILTFPQRH